MDSVTQHGKTRRPWTVAYYLCWALTTGAALTLAVAVGWEVAHISRAIGVDDGVVIFAAVPGVLLGIWLAARTGQRRGVHRALLIAGTAILVGGTGSAILLFEMSEARTGSGPFAGIGEAIAGVLAACVAVIGASTAAAGLSGRLALQATAR